jgi:hypothetical protein
VSRLDAVLDAAPPRERGQSVSASPLDRLLDTAPPRPRPSVEPSAPRQRDYSAGEQLTSALSMLPEGVGRGALFAAQPLSLIPYVGSKVIPEAPMPRAGTPHAEALAYMVDPLSGFDAEDIAAAMWMTPQEERDPSPPPEDALTRGVRETLTDPVRAVAHLGRHVAGLPEPEEITLPLLHGTARALEVGGEVLGMGGLSAPLQMLKNFSIGAASGAIPPVLEGMGVPPVWASIAAMLPFGAEFAVNVTRNPARAAAVSEATQAVGARLAGRASAIESAEQLGEATQVAINRMNALARRSIAQEIEGTTYALESASGLDRASRELSRMPGQSANASKIESLARGLEQTATEAAQERAIRDAFRNYRLDPKKPLPRELNRDVLGDRLQDAVAKTRNAVRDPLAEGYKKWSADYGKSLIALPAEELAPVMTELQGIRDSISGMRGNVLLSRLAYQSLEDQTNAIDTLMKSLRRRQKRPATRRRAPGVGPLMEEGEIVVTATELNDVIRALTGELVGTRVGDQATRLFGPRGRLKELLYEGLPEGAGAELDSLNEGWAQMKRQFDAHPQIETILNSADPEAIVRAADNAGAAKILSEYANKQPELAKALDDYVRYEMDGVLKSSDPLSRLQKSDVLNKYDRRYESTLDTLNVTPRITADKLEATRVQLADMAKKTTDPAAKATINQAIESIEAGYPAAARDAARQSATFDTQLERASKFRTIAEKERALQDLIANTIESGQPKMIQRGWEKAREMGEGKEYASAFLESVSNRIGGDRAQALELIGQNPRMLQGMLPEASQDVLELLNAQSPTLLAPLTTDALQRALTASAAGRRVMSDPNLLGPLLGMSSSNPAIVALSAVKGGREILKRSWNWNLQRSVEKLAIQGGIAAGLTEHPNLLKQLLRDIQSSDVSKQQRALNTMVKMGAESLAKGRTQAIRAGAATLQP